MGYKHEPSPSEWRGNTHDSKSGGQCGAYSMWTLCYLHPKISFPSKPSSSIMISWYRVGAQHLTSKVKQKLVLTPWETMWKHLTFARCPTTWLWQQSRKWLWQCRFWMNSVHVYHLYKLCVSLREGLCQTTNERHQTLWWLIWSVPQGNEGERPTIQEGPFFCEWNSSSEHWDA